MRLMSGIVLGHLALGTAAIVWQRDAPLAVGVVGARANGDGSRPLR
jgi:hypothetical protein